LERQQEQQQLLEPRQERTWSTLGYFPQAKVTIATGAEQTPAAPAAASSTPFASIAAPGDTAEATYVASVPADATLVTITVTVVPGGAPVVFTGSL
jgi:hypothetical protein